MTTVATAFLIGMLLSFAARATSGIDSIVSANYPSELSAAANSHHYTEVRQQAYATIKEGDREYIVAAYSNASKGAVVLLEKTGSGYTVDERILSGIGEQRPTVTARDLDGDGIPEVIVIFSAGMRKEPITWIYRVTGKELQLISPTKSFAGSAIGYPELLDFNGNGILDLVNEDVDGRGTEATVTHEHYVLRNGTYVAAEPLDFYDVFYAPKEQETQKSQFSIPASLLGKPFKMTIINGGQVGKQSRVPRAVVTLNGVKVFSAEDVFKHRGAVTIPVSLQQENTIEVELCATGNQHGEEGGGNGDGDQKCSTGGRIAIAIRHD